MNITPCHAKYFAYELTKRYSSNSLEKFTASLSDAQVDLNPHQVDAALFAFQSPLSKGAVLADEVGLGKTIEAGIVISQKWAERKRKILIIAPANLRKQWNQEIADKFFLPSIILEAKSFNEVIAKGNLNPFNQSDNIIICSYQFVKSKAVYVSKVDWDLVVIDEAHRLRNVYKPTNKIAKAIKEAVAHAPKILLTATPLQNSLLELYGLVSIIDEYAFGDLKSFKTQYTRLSEEKNFDELKRRLEPVCKRTLRRQVLEYINYTNRSCILQEFTPREDEQQLYNLVSDYLQRPNLYALPPGQRTLMTLILRKLLASSTYAISGTLQGLADKLEKTITKQENSPPNVDEVFTDHYETFEEQQDEWVEDEEEETTKEERIYTPDEIDEIKKEIEALNEFKKLAKSIRINSKGEVLFTALDKGFEKLQELKANRKAIIFTESTRTQEYLKNNLEERGYKDEIVLFNGSNNDPKSNAIYQAWLNTHAGTDRITGSRTADKRAALVDYFRDTATIMIATEAAAEGINLQFCSLVVNYDLPWNPQRIEQRIGRCHRYGQKFDVVVVNFLNNTNAADQRVYQLLDEKFQLFSGVFGASDEVLGAIESGVDFEKRIVKIYQTCRTTKAIQLAFDFLQKEMEPQIEQGIDTTRKKLLENFDEEVHEKLKINLLQSNDYLSKFENWLWQLTKYYLQPFATFNTTDNSFYLNQNPFANEPINKGPYKVGKKNIGERHEADELLSNENLYRVGHPLAQKVIAECKAQEVPVQELIFDFANSKTKISILENIKGKQGWLQAKQITISSFENEDHILFAAFDDEGNTLDPDQCQRLFSLPAKAVSTKLSFSDVENIKCKEIYHNHQLGIIEENRKRNHNFFDEEVDKLEKWSEDVRNSIKFEIKEIDKEIKTRKTEARKLLNLEQKVKEQRAIKELEKKLAEKRFNQYQNEDDIEKRKDNLLDEIEQRLKQQTTEVQLFTIRWMLI
ncbi:MAG: DEAD/DEAH box helicase family protein [Bacteroidetes bacterium]|nr:DEAD/DEAH box helicase family protein [Bacteroidota bacterium]